MPIATLKAGFFFEPSSVIVHGESPIASVDSSVMFCTSWPMQEKHCSSLRYSAVWAPFTKATRLASMTSLSGESHATLAGTHSPRNLASTLPPVMAWAAQQASADRASAAMVSAFMTVSLKMVGRRDHCAACVTA